MFNFNPPEPPPSTVIAAVVEDNQWLLLVKLGNEDEVVERVARRVVELLKESETR